MSLPTPPNHRFVCCYCQAEKKADFLQSLILQMGWWWILHDHLLLKVDLHKILLVSATPLGALLFSPCLTSKDFRVPFVLWYSNHKVDHYFRFVTLFVELFNFNEPAHLSLKKTNFFVWYLIFNIRYVFGTQNILAFDIACSDSDTPWFLVSCLQFLLVIRLPIKIRVLAFCNPCNS